jgi:hypothetical protein
MRCLQQSTVMSKSVMVTAALGLWGCAVLHRTQLGDVEHVPAGRGTPVSVKVSETTVDFNEIGDIAKSVGPAKNLGEASHAYTTYFQFGPRTGAPVFNEAYARAVPDLLIEKCSGGRLTDLVSIRETRAYPVIKGEIVRIEAVCVK